MQNKTVRLIFALSGFLLSLPGRAHTQQIVILEDGNATLSTADIGNPGTVVDLKSTIGRVGGLTVNSSNGDIYYTTGSNTPDSGAIKRVNPDGSNETTVVSGLAFPTGLVLHEPTNELFFISADTVRTIFVVPADGSSVPISIVLGDGSGGPLDLDIDTADGLLYWSDSRLSQIRRSNLSGGGETVVVDLVNVTLSGIAVDAANNRVFFSDELSGRILVAGTDGPFPTTEAPSVTSATIRTGGMALDNSSGTTRLIWANTTDSIVGTAFHEGTAQTVVGIGQIAGPVDVALAAVPTATPTPTATSTPVATATPVNSVLMPGTTIEEPPTVTVNGKTANIFLRNFTSAVQAASRALKPNAALTIRYDVRITAQKKSNNRNILSKRNELAAKNLKPGNYSVKYSVNAYTKKSKTQIARAAANGKTGFTAKFKKVFGTSFSPSATFNVGG